MSQAIAQKAPSGVMVDNPPRKLWMRQWLILGLTLLLGGMALRNYVFLRQVVQTVGQDAVPSIVAAEKIRTTLADAHTDLTNAFLNKEKIDGPSIRAYRRAMNDSQDQILTAAQNITYGDEERKPILELMDQVARYEGHVGAALDAGVVDQRLFDADTIMREKILPAAQKLDEANFSHLDSTYSKFKASAQGEYFLVLIAAIALGLALLESQVYLFRQFRRIVNLPFVLGTAVLVVCVFVFAAQGSAEMESLRSAKEDAFDSVHALSRAKAVAYQANAEESLYLLRSGDSMGQAAETERFNESARQIWHGPTLIGDVLPTDWKVFKGAGLLGDELANITFYREDVAAKAATLNWRDYIAIDAEIRALEAQGKHADAVRLCLGKDAGQSDWAFSKFDHALDDTLAVNNEAFAKSIAEALIHVHWLLYCAIGMIAAPLFGALIGLQLRLAEFRG